MNKEDNIELKSRVKDILGREFEALKPRGINEITVVISPLVKDSNPILLVSEKDFELFKKLK